MAICCDDDNRFPSSDIAIRQAIARPVLSSASQSGSSSPSTTGPCSEGRGVAGRERGVIRGGMTSTSLPPGHDNLVAVRLPLWMPLFSESMNVDGLFAGPTRVP